MTEEDEICKSLTNIFRDVFEDGDIIINQKTTANDIDDWDSIAQITLILEIEKRFSLRFSIDEIAHLANVGQMVAAIQGKLD